MSCHWFYSKCQLVYSKCQFVYIPIITRLVVLAIMDMEVFVVLVIHPFSLIIVSVELSFRNQHW